MEEQIIIGQTYGHWTVISGPTGGGHGLHYNWECECVCGVRRMVRSVTLRKKYGGCGCIGREANRKNNTTHGYFGTRLYRIWSGIKRRCNNKTDHSYQNYGAKGVKMFSEWSADFAVFCSWAMANGYQDQLTIDRIDTYGNYEPSNCRWVDFVVQNNNTRRTRFLTAFGETKPLSYWAKDERCKVCWNTLATRIQKGWDHERSIACPPFQCHSAQ